MDKYKIDSHKLIYHVPRVYQWLQGEDIFPIYLEIGLFGGCNHRCIFCAFDFLKYKPHAQDYKCLKKLIKDTAALGVKSILFSGEGEPLLYNRINQIVAFTKKQGIDVALSTNAVLLDRHKAKNMLVNLSWMRVSLNAGTRKGYAKIHQTSKEDFDKVISNLREAVKIKQKNKYNCTIGVQFLLISQNYKEVLFLAKILNNIGVDYLAIKPYTPHPLSNNKTSFIISRHRDIEEKLRCYSRDDFQIIFRNRSIEKLKEDKPYEYCLGLPFAAHISTDGNIYPCNAFVGKKDFIFGNINQESFVRIWRSQRRKNISKIVQTAWDVNKCRKSCRLDEVNRYLWELKNPVTHVNFI